MRLGQGRRRGALEVVGLVRDVHHALVGVAPARISISARVGSLLPAVLDCPLQLLSNDAALGSTLAAVSVANQGSQQSIGDDVDGWLELDSVGALEPHLT